MYYQLHNKPEVERITPAAAWAQPLSAAALRAAASCLVVPSAAAAAAAPEPSGYASSGRTACACLVTSWTGAPAAVVSAEAPGTAAQLLRCAVS